MWLCLLFCVTVCVYANKQCEALVIGQFWFCHGLRVVRTQRCAKREARKRFAVHRSVGGLKTECERVAQTITSVQVFYVQYVPSVESSRCVEGKKEKD